MVLFKVGWYLFKVGWCPFKVGWCQLCSCDWPSVPRHGGGLDNNVDSNVDHGGGGKMLHLL